MQVRRGSFSTINEFAKIARLHMHAHGLLQSGKDGWMTVIAAVRRSLVALSVAGMVAVWVKFRGGESTPPHEGGWRELSGPELR